MSLEIEAEIGYRIVGVKCGAVSFHRYVVAFFAIEASASVIGISVKRGIREGDGLIVLCYRNADGARIAVFVAENSLRPFKIHPRPAVFLVSLVRPLRRFDCEEVVYISFLNSYDARLTVNVKPSVGVEILRIYLIIKLFHHALRV